MIRLEVLGGAAVVAHLKGLTPKAQAAVKSEVTRLTLTLLRLVKERKLSGEVLRNRTGTLRRKVNYRIESDARGTIGTVGVKLSYAAVHEFGFDGMVNVRAHLRVIKQAFGRPIEARAVTVPEHQRHMKLPRRSFLRSALAELGPKIQTGLADALRKAL